MKLSSPRAALHGHPSTGGHFGTSLACQSDTRHPSMEATMYGRNDLAVLAFCLTLLVPGQLRARDDGRFAGSPLKPWFDRLASGKGLCCSFADGVTVQDVDWDHAGWALSCTNLWAMACRTRHRNCKRAQPFWSGRCMAVSGSRRYRANSLLHAGRRHLISANRDICKPRRPI